MRDERTSGGVVDGRAVALALTAVACGALSAAMAVVATTASFAAMAVLLLAALVLLGAAGTRLHGSGSTR